MVAAAALSSTLVGIMDAESLPVRVTLKASAKGTSSATRNRSRNQPDFQIANGFIVIPVDGDHTPA
jgi:hypothetical protein